MNFLKRLWTWFFPPAKDESKPGDGYLPKQGYAWNQLKKHRNLPCPCQSGFKAKHCCGRFSALPKDVAGKVQAYLNTLPAGGST